MRPAASLALPRLPVAASVIEYRRLRRSARRPIEAVAADQRRRLQAAVAGARRDVPLYRDLYRELPAGPIELARLPFIDKGTIRACRDEDRRSGPVPPGTRHLMTSGTTGDSASTDWSPRAAWYQAVLTLRMASAQGVGPLHRRAALVWNPDRRTGFGGIFGRLRERHVQIAGYEGPAAAARELEAARPDLVWGHSHELIELEGFLSPSFRPRVINTAGQELTGEDRRTLRRIYGTEPLDVYSTSEQGVVAWQCAAADLYHINAEAVIVETLAVDGDPVPAGDSGELVVTGLCNPLMPYLRRRTGDAGVLATRPCRCGFALPALERIEGRISDWLLDERGRRVPPHRFYLSTHLERGLERVHRYQVVQFPSGQVRVQLVPREELSADALDAMARSYRRVLGASTPVEIDLVEEIAGPRSHKFRTVMAATTEA